MKSVVMTVATDQGDGRLTRYRSNSPRAQLALGHGFGGGINSRDLDAIAAVLPATDIDVILVEQPWVVAGKKLAPAPNRLDAAWLQLVDAIDRELPLFVGGRSAGARVACRTAIELEAAGVVALAFPLHAPGKTEASRADELLRPTQPLQVVQGTRDTFGTYDEIRKVIGRRRNRWVSAIEGADHGFAVRKDNPVPQEESDLAIAEAVAEFLIPDGRAGL